MSILDFLWVLWGHLETLINKLTFIVGDGTIEDASWIHPEHRLQPIERRDPFYCVACREIGFVRSYSCEQCMVHFHKECMSPRPTTSHPLPEYPGDLSFVRSIETHDDDTDDEGGIVDVGGKFCGACAKLLRGCGYTSAGGKSSFHPCCLHLDRFIEVNGETLKLKRKNISLKCNWCKTVSIRARKAVMPSWSYVSTMGKDHSFHVGCIQDMMLKSWTDSAIDQPARGKEEDHSSNFTTCLSIKIKLPIDPEEERDADPMESGAQKMAVLVTEDFSDGNDPVAVAKGDRANQMVEVMIDCLSTFVRRVESGSGFVWEGIKVLWRLLILKIRGWIASKISRATGKVWELIRPLLQWVSSKLCELASRMLTGTSSPLPRLPHGAQAYLMDSI